MDIAQTFVDFAHAGKAWYEHFHFKGRAPANQLLSDQVMCPHLANR